MPRNENSKASYFGYLRRNHAIAILSGTMFLIGWGLLLFEPRWIRVVGAIAIGACLSIGIVDCYRKGEIKTNWYTVTRNDSPLVFRLTLSFWILLAIAFASIVFLVATGWVHPNERGYTTQ